MVVASAVPELTSGLWWTLGVIASVVVGSLAGIRLWQLWPQRADAVSPSNPHDWPPAVFRRVEAWEAAERHVETRRDTLPAAGGPPEYRATI
jgi:hypothetical protein